MIFRSPGVVNLEKSHPTFCLSSFKKLYEVPQYTPYTKDAFHRYVINGESEAICPKAKGTKVAAHHVLEIPGGEERVVRCRLTIAKNATEKPFGDEFEKIFQSRKEEADQFYDGVLSGWIIYAWIQRALELHERVDKFTSEFHELSCPGHTRTRVA